LKEGEGEKRREEKKRIFKFLLISCVLLLVVL